MAPNYLWSLQHNYVVSNRLKMSLVAWVLGTPHQTVCSDTAAFWLTNFEVQISINILLWIEIQSHLGIKAIPVLCLGLGTPVISSISILERLWQPCHGTTERLSIFPMKTDGWVRSEGVFLRNPKQPLKPLRGEMFSMNNPWPPTWLVECPAPAVLRCQM